MATATRLVLDTDGDVVNVIVVDTAKLPTIPGHTLAVVPADPPGVGIGWKRAGSTFAPPEPVEPVEPDPAPPSPYAALQAQIDEIVDLILSGDI
jgi:hypothetical protein